MLCLVKGSRPHGVLRACIANQRYHYNASGSLEHYNNVSGYSKPSPPPWQGLAAGQAPAVAKH